MVTWFDLALKCKFKEYYRWKGILKHMCRTFCREGVNNADCNRWDGADYGSWLENRKRKLN